MRKLCAFTLVELLVVIGIIALLISILLPALSSVRSQSRVVACLANLRTYGQVLNIYTNMNKGYLPRRFREGVQTNYGGPHWSLIHTDDGKGYSGPGLLVTSRAVNSPNAFFCPTFPVDSYSRDLQNSRGKWPDEVTNVTPKVDSNVRSSYHYNAHWRNFKYPNGTVSVDNAYKKIRDVPRQKFLAYDVTMLSTTISHNFKNKPSWNVLFPDGSAQSVRSTLLFKEMQKRELEVGATTTQITDTWNDGANPHFDDYRDILETEVQGLNPRTARPNALPGPTADPLRNRVYHPAAS